MALALAGETQEWNKRGINEEYTVLKYTVLRKYVYYEEEPKKSQAANHAAVGYLLPPIFWLLEELVLGKSRDCS